MTLEEIKKQLSELMAAIAKMEAPVEQDVVVLPDSEPEVTDKEPEVEETAEVIEEPVVEPVVEETTDIDTEDNLEVIEEPEVDPPVSVVEDTEVNIIEEPVEVSDDPLAAAQAKIEAAEMMTAILLATASFHPKNAKHTAQLIASEAEYVNGQVMIKGQPINDYLLALSNSEEGAYLFFNGSNSGSLGAISEIQQLTSPSLQSELIKEGLL